MSNEQNFPTTQGHPQGEFAISVNNAEAMSIALKNLAYRDIFKQLLDARCFNVKMLDGALLMFRYRFQDARIYEHSLSYFPSPDLEHFQNEPDLYLEDEIYADIVAKNIVPFPVRFDYNQDAQRFVEMHHPYSHLTLGQYANCRIPVCSPMTPFGFCGFILRSFYNTAYKKYSDDLPQSVLSFHNTITDNERNIPHMVISA